MKLKKIFFLNLILSLIFSANVFALNIPFWSTTTASEKVEYIKIIEPQNNTNCFAESITINGTVDEKVKLLFINDKEISINKDRSFKVLVNLPQLGENIFQFKAYHKRNTYSLKILTINHYKISSQPKLHLINPEKDFTTEKGMVIFEGETEKAVKLTINNIEVPIRANTFSYKAVLTMPQKKNTFEVVAYSQEGLTTSLTRQIEYTPKADETKAPDLTIISPANLVKSSKKEVLFKGKTLRTKELFINNKNIQLDKKGNFFHIADLTKENEYNTFTIIGVSASGQSKTIERKVYYYLPVIISTNNIMAEPIKKEDKFLNETKPISKIKKVNEVKKVKVVTKKTVKSKGQIKIISPVDNLSTEKDLVLFKGKTQNIDKLFINDKTISLDKQGNFYYKAILSNINDYNIFKIIGFTQNDKVELVRKVYYKKLNKPVFIFLNPTNNKIIISKDEMEVSGQVNNAENISINGLPIKLDTNGKFAFLIKFKEVHVAKQFTIIAESKDKITASKTLIITHIPPVQLELSLISPPDNFISLRKTVFFKGNAKNAEKLLINEKEIKLKKDGTFFKRIELQKPNEYHNFTIAAINENGKKELLKKVFYKVALVPSFVSFSSEEEITSTINKVEIYGKVQNAESLKVNEEAISIAPDGSFKFEIEARNANTKEEFIVSALSKDKLAAEKKVTFIYKPILQPELAVITPEDNFISGRNLVLFKGNAKNAEKLLINEKEIKLKKDGTFFERIELQKPNEYHNFTIAAINENGKKELLKKVFYKVVLVPSFVSFSPEEEITSTINKVEIYGKVKNAESLKVNEEAISIAPDGSFKFEIEALKPNNKEEFTIKAISKDKLATEKKITLIFNPVILPELNILSPANNFISGRDTILIKGEVKNADKVLINNEEVTLKEGKFFYKLKLEPNKYINYEIIALSDSGRTEITQKAFYTLPQQIEKPVLVVTAPEDNFVSSTDSVLFSGTVANAQKLLINNEVINIRENGSFSEKLIIPTANKYISYVIKAVNGLEEDTIIKKVFYAYIAPKIAEKKISEEKIIRKESIKVVEVQLEPAPEPAAITPKSQEVVAEKNITMIEEKITPKINGVPVITLTGPENNFVTYKNTVLIEGNVKNTKELFINEEKINFDKLGNFSKKINLKNAGKYIFNIFAQGENNLNAIQTRSIFRTAFSSNYLEREQEKDKVNELLDKNISLELANADIKIVLKILAQKGNLNIVADKSLDGVLDISLKDIKLRNAIDLVLNSQGLSYKIIDDTILVASSAKLENPTSLKTKIIKLNNIKADIAEKVLAEHLSATEKIQSVAQDNLLIINADSKKIDRLVTIANRLDEQKIPQIILEARILETSTAALKGLGISWPQNIGVGANMSFGSAQTNVQSNTSIAAIINFLEENGQAKILARPNIKAINEKEASIFIGDKVPYTQTIIDTTGKITETIKFIDSGITLLIQPFINPQEKLITIKIEPEVSFIYGWRGKNNDIPWVKSRKVSTTVSLNDGETVVIGGLFNSSDTDNLSRMPLLGDLPLVGNLFVSNKLDKAETQLIITVTPKIISEQADENTFINELKTKEK